LLLSGKNFDAAHTETSLVHNYNKYVDELDKDGELTLADVEYGVNRMKSGWSQKKKGKL
jgi:hypothetical protein